jgi:hypothetical protein
MMMKVSRPLSGTLSVLAAAIALTLACDQSQAAAAEGSAPAPPATPGDGARGAAEGPKVDEQNFTAEMKASGAFEAGKKGTVDVVLEPKGAYKINDKYPTKLSLKETEGLTFEKVVLRREDGEFTDKKGTFRVSFTPAAKGKAKVAGKLSMSVCSDANCIMEKVDLALEVDVK